MRKVTGNDIHRQMMRTHATQDASAWLVGLILLLCSAAGGCVAGVGLGWLVWGR